MTAEAHHQPLLGTQRLRTLIREARGGFTADHVARALRHCSPEVIEDDAGEMEEILRELAGIARARLIGAGLEPAQGERPTRSRLPKRERENVSNLGALLAFHAAALAEIDRLDDALATAREGLAWCRTAEDYRQQAVLWRLIGSIHEGLSELDEEEHAARRAIEAARISRSPMAIVESLDTLCALLILRWQLDEAATVSEEALAIARTEMHEGERAWIYPDLLTNSSRIRMCRTEYAEGIRILREALRWADGDINPLGRARILTHLGAVYLRLQDYRQSIECQHEVIQLAESGGSSLGRSWGYFRLAEAHFALGELDKAREMLDRAAEGAPAHHHALALTIAGKRAQILLEGGDLDEAARLCAWILAQIGDRPIPDLAVFAHRTHAQIDERRGDHAEAEQRYRASIEIAEQNLHTRVPAIKLSLAEFLFRLERNDEVETILDELAPVPELNPTEQMKICSLRSAIAERRGDLRLALAHEREAFAHERVLLERRAEESLKNARILAETDLLEREADVERERRRRVERELAEAIVQLSDRKRLVASVEQRLNRILERTTSEHERAIVTTLRETLAELRAQSHPPESPLRYLNGVDDDFYRRLRQRFPDLTPKQERLCGLLRAGLASKEISSLLGLEPEGLKAQRKRLRKKLELGASERLESVLAEL